MSQTLNDLIPGLKEAEDRYKAENAEAFAGVEPRICGRVEVLPMTPRMLLELQGGENALVVETGRHPNETDVLTLIWRCSPLYKRGDEELRRFVQATLVELPYEDAVLDCLEYVRRSLAGQPLWKSSIGAKPGVGNWCARLVHLFARQYGWEEEYILDRPLRRLWQYANRILEAEDPKYRESAPDVLRLRRDFLLKVNAKPAAPL